MLPISIEALAVTLQGRQYREEITKDECRLAEHAGLVVVFGASDDICELRGAIDDEVGVADGDEISIDKDGLVPTWDQVHHDNYEEVKAYFVRTLNNVAAKIRVSWCDKPGGFNWSYTIDVPHISFDIFDGDDKYCRGIIFGMADINRMTIPG